MKTSFLNVKVSRHSLKLFYWIEQCSTKFTTVQTFFQQYLNNPNRIFWLKAAPIGAANEKLPSKLHQHSKVYKGYAPWYFLVNITLIFALYGPSTTYFALIADHNQVFIIFIVFILYTLCLYSEYSFKLRLHQIYLNIIWNFDYYSSGSDSTTLRGYLRL